MSNQGFFLEDLQIGQSSERTQTVGQGDIEGFAAVSGDRNPLHLDPVYAERTQFKGPIAHGMLSASYISAILGMDLPGPGAVYLSQTLIFKRPVRPGDIVLARATVSAIDAVKGRVTFKTECLVGGKVVIDGEADVMVPRRPVEVGDG